MADQQSDPNAAAVAELSREDILRQIFGDVGELIDDFTCAVESTVLLHGRMYITTKYICFYSNLFGLEKKIRIPYSHIKSITKENTAMVIPNAIAINTDKRDYLFRSFWDREDCYRILNLFLEKFKTHGRIEVTLPRTISDAPLPSLESVMAGSSTPQGSSSIPATTNETAIPTVAAGTNSATINDTVESKRASTKARPVSVIIDTPIEDLIDAESIPKADSEQDLPSLYQSELEKSRYKIAVTSGTMDVSLKNFMALFVDETAPYSYKRYHESVKDTNLDASKWEEMPSTGSFGREIKFFKPVNLPGLASTRGVKIQKYRKFGDHALLLWSSTRLEDVPAADAFSVDDLLAVQALGENQVSVEISFQVTFLKSTYMKYIIESSTNAEMKKWLEVFFQHLKKITDNFKDGKVSLDGPPLAEATIVDSASGKDAAPSEPVVDSSSTAGSKGSTGSDSLFALVRNFQNETLGDRIKTILILVLIAFLLYNLFAWRGVHRQMRALESKIVNLEKLLEAAVNKK